jgi:hypothetical protein
MLRFILAGSVLFDSWTADVGIEFGWRSGSFALLVPPKNIFVGKPDPSRNPRAKPVLPLVRT